VETKEEEELPEADWNEVDPNMPPLIDITSGDEGFQSALGETIEPIAKEKQECENYGFMNSLLDFYCSSCKFGLTAQGTTPVQREKLI